MSPRPRSGLGVFAGYHSAQVAANVRLNTNESPFPPPPYLLTRWSEAVRDLSLNRYPDRQATLLRQAIARFHKVEPEMVFVANGSNEVIQSILLAYGGSEGKAASFEPTYAMYETISRVTATPYVAIERGADLRIDAERLEADLAAAAASLVFVCSPNNPTGVAEDMEVFSALASDPDRLVVVDEAYGQFSPQSMVPEVASRSNLVVVRTFSKVWSLAGMRIGYAIAPPEVTEVLWKVALPYHLDSSKQLLALYSLDYVSEMEERVAQLVAERERMAGRLLGLPVDQWPSAANFILFRPRHADAGRLWEQLVERGILVRDWSRWPRLENCLRVTIGTESENRAFLGALEELLA
ncbi:MAG: histidinol-phosphate transaminase [Actinomycetota bacterium]|nr:histidinol-phosphate transaminase [Actinomycetota bacterium]